MAPATPMAQVVPIAQVGPVAPVGPVVPVCDLSALQPERGVAALLPDGTQVAVFLTSDGGLHALGNVDPFSGAAVLSRGIVGDRGGVPVVISPLYKQAFELSTGRCLDDPAVVVESYPVSVVEGVVRVGAP
ncbi:nitrite reductase small subunit NirD [Actinosynnema mirum]|uniref:Nitrite reductase (NAD(P)H), small subunit n=1 Tax=Actinosynnema mirum (strain ATCC 29888 / DSM 43827 / JCM 3225 / NBRC 14064 / NCIMB 13271 / NRRL B-12336 / IMRU 3971 / 101) TaxID=446462 RepID=C6WM66_ACTMD|nr:nitrite reductase (NAD(P)H), small subunit [Actinosynnema mirum DSM 43827]